MSHVEVEIDDTVPAELDGYIIARGARAWIHVRRTMTDARIASVICTLVPEALALLRAMCRTGL